MRTPLQVLPKMQVQLLSKKLRSNIQVVPDSSSKPTYSCLRGCWFAIGGRTYSVQPIRERYAHQVSGLLAAARSCSCLAVLDHLDPRTHLGSRNVSHGRVRPAGPKCLADRVRLRRNSRSRRPSSVAAMIRPGRSAPPVQLPQSERPAQSKARQCRAMQGNAMQCPRFSPPQSERDLAA